MPQGKERHVESWILREFFADIAETAMVADVGECLEIIASAATMAAMKMDGIPGE